MSQRRFISLGSFVYLIVNPLFQYEEMKAILYNAVQEAPSAEVVEPKVLARFFANFDESFFTFCEKGYYLSCWYVHRGQA